MTRLRAGVTKGYGSRDTFGIEVAGSQDASRPVTIVPQMDVRNVLNIAMYVRGKNVWATLAPDPVDDLGYIPWDARPIARWFVENWIALTHEEALPLPDLGVTGAEAAGGIQREIVDSLPARGARAHELTFAHAWWTRHALRAADDSGLLPNMVFRRDSDQLEVSWDSRYVVPGVERRFVEGAGAELLDLQSVRTAVAGFVSDWLDDASARRLEEAGTVCAPGSALPIPSSEEAAAWLGGLYARPFGDPKDGRARASDFQELLRIAAPEVKEGIAEHTAATLLFRSVAPTITADDVLTLKGILVEGSAPIEPSATFRSLARKVPILSDQPPWAQGYELAASTRDDLGLAATERVDSDKVLEELGVQHFDIGLSDLSLRAVAVRTEAGGARILLNRNSPTAAIRHAVDMALSHELAHLLFDEGYGKPVAVASGPWAPRGIERRANAFAAYFRMPKNGIRTLLGFEPHERTVLPRDVSRLMSTFGVGSTVTLNLLLDLRWIDDMEYDMLHSAPQVSN